MTGFLFLQITVIQKYWHGNATMNTRCNGVRCCNWRELSDNLVFLDCQIKWIFIIRRKLKMVHRIIGLESSNPRIGTMMYLCLLTCLTKIPQVQLVNEKNRKMKQWYFLFLYELNIEYSDNCSFSPLPKHQPDTSASSDFTKFRWH